MSGAAYGVIHFKAPSSSAPTKQKHFKAEEWEPHKAFIIGLSKNGKSSNYILQRLQQEKSFSPSLNSLKQKLRSWNPKYKVRGNNATQAAPAAPENHDSRLEDQMDEDGDEDNSQSQTLKASKPNDEAMDVEQAVIDIEAHDEIFTLGGVSPPVQFGTNDPDESTELVRLGDSILSKLNLGPPENLRKETEGQSPAQVFSDWEEAQASQKLGDTEATRSRKGKEQDTRGKTRHLAWKFTIQQLFEIASSLGERQNRAASFSETPLQTHLKRMGISGDDLVLTGDQDEDEFCETCTQIASQFENTNTKTQLSLNNEEAEEYAGELLDKSDEWLANEKLVIGRQAAKDALSVLVLGKMAEDLLLGQALYNIARSTDALGRRRAYGTVDVLDLYRHAREHFLKAKDYVGAMYAWQSEGSVQYRLDKEDDARRISEQILEFVLGLTNQRIFNLTYEDMVYFEAMVLTQLCFYISPGDGMKLKRRILSSFSDPSDEARFRNRWTESKEYGSWLLSEGKFKEATRYQKAIFEETSSKYGLENDRAIISAAEYHLVLLGAQDYDQATQVWSWLYKLLFARHRLLKKYFVYISPIFSMLGQHAKALEVLHWGIDAIAACGNCPKFRNLEMVVLDEAKRQTTLILYARGLPMYAQPIADDIAEAYAKQYGHDDPRTIDAVSLSVQISAGLLPGLFGLDP